ncbi:putative glycoside hydrolase [Cohnella cellulosilytica]|uniref:Glycoside hydrolase n=1 Tax=Cohnella cellulosilytica TaxID=986710 RepID=A0ABW2FND3_9BACL
MAARPITHLRCLILFLVATLILISGCSTEASNPAATNDLHKLEKSLQRVAERPAEKLTLKRERLKAAAPSITPRKPSGPVKAIYVTSYVASGSRMNELVDLVKRTELNAIVLDINSGIALTTPGRQGAGNGAIRPLPSQRKAAEHYREVIRKLKRQNIYLIARIVTFKNPELAKAVPAWAIKRKNGATWTDKNGTPWVDPYRQASWEYPISLAEYAAKLGFDEVQFDYVRFPENETKVDKEVKYANPRGWTKARTIAAFLHQAKTRMHKVGIPISADVFGMVGSSEDDMGIGQTWNEIASQVDFISPMVYPSHYSEGTWAIAHPDLSPGPIVKHALKEASDRNRELSGKGVVAAQIRPWLQSFTATWVHPHQQYGAAQIREQIAAARKAGITSYMLWNSSCKYPEFKS